MNVILLLGILLLVGVLATRGSKLISLPNVTAYLVIGVVVAGVCLLVDSAGFTCNDGLKLSEELTRLNTFISSIALGFIALAIGEEFRLSRIKEYGGKVMLITIFQAMLAVIFVDVVLLIVCAIFKVNLAIAICLGAIATATAPAATLMVIHQYKAHGPLVDILLPVVAFDDAIGLVVFSISSSLGTLFVTNTGVDLVTIVVKPLIEIVGSLGIGFVLGLLLHITIKYFKSRANHLTVRIAFTLLGVGSCAALNLLKMNDIPMQFSSLLTCMMIGATYVNLAKHSEEAIVTRDIALMERWTSFLFTLFFVLSGSHLVICAFDMFSSSDASSFIIPAIVIFACYLIFRSLGKYLGAFAGSKITKQSPEICKYLGFTLLPQAGVAIGMANQISSMSVFGVEHIGQIIVTVVLLATLIYELFGPLVTKAALIKAGEIDKNSEE